MPTSTRAPWFLLAVLCGLLPLGAKASSYGPGALPDGPFSYTFGTSASYGLIAERDASFWGASLNYSYALTDEWGLGFSFAYDQETETFANQPRNTINSFTAIITPYYRVNDWLTVSGGVGKGIVDDDNGTGRLQFKDGDWAVGSAVSIDLFTRDHFSIGLDTSLEYNVTQKEWSISWDLGCSLAF